MKNDKEFSHLAADGSARMVDVGGKSTSQRMARAESWVETGAEIIDRLAKYGGISKGDVRETARIAGIMAAKKTHELIPMCHQLAIDVVEIEITLQKDRIHIESCVRCEGKTGVEMEAMTAVSVSALTVYDMIKSAGKGIVIGPVRLLEKSGGKSGHWKREEI